MKLVIVSQAEFDELWNKLPPRSRFATTPNIAGYQTLQVAGDSFVMVFSGEVITGEAVTDECEAIVSREQARIREADGPVVDMYRKVIPTVVEEFSISEVRKCYAEAWLGSEYPKVIYGDGEAVKTLLVAMVDAAIDKAENNYLIGLPLTARYNGAAIIVSDFVRRHQLFFYNYNNPDESRYHACLEWIK